MAHPIPKTDLDSPVSELDLFIIGKTGHGKSATANYILGSQEFVTSDSGSSETRSTQVAWARRSNHIIKVVDGPGLADTGLDKQGQMAQTEKNIKEALFHCPHGFHALLLVLKYGNSFTAEEQQTVDILKKMFGATLIEKHSVLIFTHGENFDMNNKKKGITFQDWCNNQTGALQTLINECGNRCLLFYNQTEEKSDATVDDLLKILKVRVKNNRRYTHNLFEIAREKRRSLLKRKSAPELWEATRSRIMMMASAAKLLATAKTNNEKLAEVRYLREDSSELEKTVMECLEQEPGAESKGVLEKLNSLVLTIKVNSEKLELKIEKKGAASEAEGDLVKKIKESGKGLEEVKASGNIKLTKMSEASV